MAVQERAAAVVTQEGVVNLVRRQCRGERHVASGDRFGHAEDVRLHGAVLAGEHPAGASEAGEDLVGNQRDAVRSSDLANVPEKLRGPDDHAARALHHRLDDHGGHRRSVTLENRLEAASGRALGVRSVRMVNREEQIAELRPELLHVSDRHRAEGVSVVRALDRHERRAARVAAIAPVLIGHLQRGLDRGGPVVRVEDMRKRSRGSLDELPRQPRSRLVREACEHDVRHLLRLAAQRFVEAGMVVPCEC